jgi:hypothetical protein
MELRERRQCREKYVTGRARLRVPLPPVLSTVPIQMVTCLLVLVVVLHLHYHQTTPIAAAVLDQAKQDRPLPYQGRVVQRQSSVGPTFAAFVQRDYIFACQSFRYITNKGTPRDQGLPSRGHRPAAFLRILAHLGPVDQRALLAGLSASASCLLPSALQAGRGRRNPLFHSCRRRRCRSEGVVHGHVLITGVWSTCID